MEGGFPFGMFGGDPSELQKQLDQMAEQMQAAQKVSWADNAILLDVQMTVACINRLDLAGAPGCCARERVYNRKARRTDQHTTYDVR